MAGSSQGYHEDASVLSSELQDRHRAIVSIMEELEAIDWYDQRVAAATDAELAALLAHNRDEEKEHASMLLEWLRRRDQALDATLRQYLFQEASPLAIEAQVEAGSGTGASAQPAPPADGTLGIGTLKGTTNL
jgi:ferritin-like protein